MLAHNVISPEVYKNAMEYSKKIVEASGVQINYLNVGRFSVQL